MADAAVPSKGKDHFDVDYAFIAHLNGECADWAGLDSVALQRALLAQGADWSGLVEERCPYLFAAAPVYISELQLLQMREVITAVEEVVSLPAWEQRSLPSPSGRGGRGEGEVATDDSLTPSLEEQLAIRLSPQAGKSLVISHGERVLAKGVFYGYDFHLNEQGAHLIEINTNAGGPFLNALLIDSQLDPNLYGAAVATENLEQAFIEMFRTEWRLAHGDAPLRTIAIVDEQPESQYLYPEFLLAKVMFERADIAAHIADPSALQERDGGLYCNDQRIDLIYNRLTDFDLKQHVHIRSAWEKQQVALTPNPAHYARYADKRKLAQLSDGAWLRSVGVSQASIDGLLQGVPETRIVHAEDADQWWTSRKQWFFKPVSGYGGKGAYRGEKLTRRVFEEIMQSDYVAQKLVVPGERRICLHDAEPQLLKYDVRCYVYDGHIQLIAARLYQGQTTNFRTPGGGFAPVRVVV